VKGRIDIIFANAGVGEFVPSLKSPKNSSTGNFDVNVKGALFTAQKGLPLLYPLNVVSPGPIRTAVTNRRSADVIERIVSTVSMGRMRESLVNCAHPRRGRASHRWQSGSYRFFRPIRPVVDFVLP
jgi:hypothetical protein